MSASVKEKIFQSFSNLKAVILQDELERMGKIDPAEIEQAQQELAFVITYLLDIEVIQFESDHYTRQTEILGVFMD
jgi:flagellar motor switch protein FliG